jgi:carbonic anhydrase
MSSLREINTDADIPAALVAGPVGQLLRFHNLGATLPETAQAELLIGMCIDNRQQLRLPHNFAFIIRAAGANLRHSDFNISFAIAAGGVRAIALIGHSQCGMVNVSSRKDEIVAGLTTHAGWDKEAAERHFDESAPQSEITHEVDFVLSETQRLRQLYPQIPVTPLIYKVEDHRLYLVNE